MTIVTKKELLKKAGFKDNEPEPSSQRQFLEVATLPKPTRMEIVDLDPETILNYSITEQKAIISALVLYLPKDGCSVIVVDEKNKQRTARVTRIANEGDVDDVIHLLLTP